MISALTKKFTIAALITSCFFVFACENKMGDVQKWGRKHPQVDEARNIESFLSLEGKMKARLTAPVMLRYLDTLTEFPKSLHVDFYNDSLKVESQLSAKYGRFRESEHVVYLRDSVVVFNVSGDTLFCKDLYWDQHKGTFYTEKDVLIRKPGNQVMPGKGLTAAQDFRSYTIKQVYNGVINIPDSSGLPQ